MQSSPSLPLLPPQFDVVVVGGGAAGLYSALCLPKTLKIGLITKDTLSISASDWAQGGIAAAIAPDDAPELHLADTLKAGAGLCDRAAVDLLVRQAGTCIQTLTQMGVAFDRNGNNLAMTLEAAHSRKRVLHAADTTGRAVISTLAARILHQPHIQVFNQAIALDLWMEAGECCGLQLVYANQIQWVQAKAVILATGGGGQIYSQTTNPAASTGDGVAMAWRAGATLRDLEFMQFHPTALTQVGAPRFLISEAVRGEGAHLIDRSGRRFAFDYHPDGELAPRDVVSRAIFNHLYQNPQESVVYLDLRVISPDRVRYRFPNIMRKCQAWANLNILEAPIPVSPAAHYWMGGIVTDLKSQTTLPHLYAVGENASTGVHGANRLASNSLLECLVFGAQLAGLSLTLQQPTGRATHPMHSTPDIALLDSFSDIPVTTLQTEWAWLTHHRVAIGNLLWSSAGIARTGNQMDAALTQLAQWHADFQSLTITQDIEALPPHQCCQLPPQLTADMIRQWSEVRNLLTVARLVLKSALFRTESRGGHYRSDYPEIATEWQRHTLVQANTLYRSGQTA